MVGDYCWDVILCNPVLQEAKLLPKSKNSNNYSCVAVGFGYDSVANGYHFIRIFKGSKFKAELYSLGKDAWRQINVHDVLNPDFELTSQYDYLYCKGCCYWGMEDYKEDFVILCFNMSTKKFHSIPIPDAIKSWTSSVSWNDSIAFLDYNKERENPNSVSIEIWVMDEYDLAKCDEGSFTWSPDLAKEAWPRKKHLVIGPLVGLGRSLAFWNSDELLMKDDDKRLISYNLRTKKLRNIGADGKIHLSVCFYIKSLVSVRGSGSSSERAKAREKWAERKRARWWK